MSLFLNYRYAVFFSLFMLTVSCKQNKYPQVFEENQSYNQEIVYRYSGFYLDTCLNMIFADIQKDRNLLLGDFRVLSHMYETPLATIPKDTSGKYFSISLVYQIMKPGYEESRAASYLANMDYRLKRVYDVNTGDTKAKEQLQALKSDLLRINEGLKEFPDSVRKELQQIQQKLETLKQ